MMRLLYSQVNQAWFFTFWGQITQMGDHGRFFRGRDEAVAAALAQGLRVDANGFVHQIHGEGDPKPDGSWGGVSQEWTHSPQEVTKQLPPADEPGREKQGSILDPVHETLDPRVWDDPASPEPFLKPEVRQWIVQVIFEALERHGYSSPSDWLTLILTGSLTTYQYSDASDCDVSLFIDTEKLPDWSRAELIAIMVKDFDGVNLPGTPHPIQAYVVAHDVTPQDLYKPGLRSGYIVFGQDSGTWIVPPDRERIHDVEKEMNDAYTVGLLAADKLDLLLKYEPDQASEYWHQLHKQRMASQAAGEGDFTRQNVVYKMIINRFGENPLANLT